MRIFGFTSLDDSADNNGTFAPDVNSANQVTGSYADAAGDTLPDAINSVGIDWQTVGIAPYQSAAAAMGPFTLSASDPVAAGEWLTQDTQIPASAIDGWLTQTMQTGGAASQTWGAGTAISAAPMAGTPVVSGAGFDANGDQIFGAAPVTSLALPNPLQTHTV